MFAIGFLLTTRVGGGTLGISLGTVWGVVGANGALSTRSVVGWVVLSRHQDVVASALAKLSAGLTFLPVIAQR